MSITLKSGALATGMLTILTVALSDGAHASPTSSDRGVCWNYTIKETIPSREIPDRAVGAYCFQLRDGLDDLEHGKTMAALEKFQGAQKAAMVIPDLDARALAADEARAAVALTLEATDKTREALELLGQRAQSRIDTLALARAFMLARQEDFDGAAEAFNIARQQLPAFWCDKTENAAAAIRMRATGQTVPWPAEANDHHLPSYLIPANASGVCVPTKSHMSSVPTTFAFHAAFDLGAKVPGPGAKVAVRDMAERLRSWSDKLGSEWRWVVVGHADEACPVDKSVDCASFNMELSRKRAEMVRAELENLFSASRGIKQALRVDYKGMEHPAYPQGFGKEDRRNRRVDLKPERVEAAAISDPQCPWEVTLYRGDLAGALERGGSVSTITEVLRPESTTVVGRNIGYSIRYKPGQSHVPMRYFYAFSEIETTEKADLAAMAGVGSNELSALSGMELPPGKVFRPDATARQEEINLYASDERVDWLEALRRAPLTAQMRPDTGSGREIPVGRRFMTGINGAQVSMAGLTKGWTDQSGKINSKINITFKREPDGGPIAAPVVRAPSTGKAPTVLACFFRLSIQ